MELFQDPIWQMSNGERAAVEGLLTVLAPRLAIEIGTAEGASLRRIAHHSAEVHSFDLEPPSLPDAVAPHVRLHTGDSHVLLPQVLQGFAAEGRNVDFVLVDGDHSPEGVRRDIEDLLNSPAIGHTTILVHDTGNERVRSGVDAVHYPGWPKVAHVELDFVPGHLADEEAWHNELWWGLGLIVVDASRAAYFAPSAVHARYHHGGEVLALARDAIEGRAAERREAAGLQAARLRAAELERQVQQLARQVAELEGAITEHQGRWETAMSSISWRITAPLRRSKGRLRRAGDA